MENTTHLNLKKPDYTDFADIFDINDNMDEIDKAIHDTKESTSTFTSSDVEDGSAKTWTPVTKVDSGETHKSIFAKMSQMFKNIRFLYKLLGTTDISKIGDGTVTGGLSSLNDSLTNLILLRYTITSAPFTISAGSNKDVDLNVYPDGIPNGYKYIGSVGWRLEGISGASIGFGSLYYTVGTKASVHNYGTQSGTWRVAQLALYYKNDHVTIIGD